jgi:hypothetical protein
MVASSFNLYLQKTTGITARVPPEKCVREISYYLKYTHHVSSDKGKSTAALSRVNYRESRGIVTPDGALVFLERLIGFFTSQVFVILL